MNLRVYFMKWIQYSVFLKHQLLRCGYVKTVEGKKWFSDRTVTHSIVFSVLTSSGWNLEGEEEKESDMKLRGL